MQTLKNQRAVDGRRPVRTFEGERRSDGKIGRARRRPLSGGMGRVPVPLRIFCSATWRAVPGISRARLLRVQPCSALQRDLGTESRGNMRLEKIMSAVVSPGFSGEYSGRR